MSILLEIISSNSSVTSPPLSLIAHTDVTNAKGQSHNDKVNGKCNAKSHYPQCLLSSSTFKPGVIVFVGSAFCIGYDVDHDQNLAFLLVSLSVKLI